MGMTGLRMLDGLESAVAHANDENLVEEAWFLRGVRDAIAHEPAQGDEALMYKRYYMAGYRAWAQTETD